MTDEGYSCEYCNEGVLPGLRCGCQGETRALERERIIQILIKPIPYNPEIMGENKRICTSGVNGWSVNETFLRAVLEPR